MKILSALMILLFCIASCGPKRMKCYNKRCVEHTQKQTTVQKKHKIIAYKPVQKPMIANQIWVQIHQSQKMEYNDIEF